MNYVDIKYEVWERHKFKEDADMNKIVELLKEDDGIFDEELGFIESSILYETMYQMNIENNQGFSTVEVYKDDELIYEDGINDNIFRRDNVVQAVRDYNLNEIINNLAMHELLENNPSESYNSLFNENCELDDKKQEEYNKLYDKIYANLRNTVIK